ncbi:hypothetical protein [Halostella litorea]|uniref:hypothetical protein n=1 Tax=Halostella litorea TaxID=2528831 RepID=UPI0010922508|nr:hypothetical protein [Halostella litorea]
MTSRSTLLDDRRIGVALAWLFVGFLLFAVVESLVTGAPLWAGFAAVVAGVALIPAVVRRSVTAIPPPELLGLAALPAVVRTYGLYTQLAGYVAVASLALLVAVELDAFTEVEMTARFAIAFVVITTLAVSGVWTVVRFVSDATLGTAYIADVPDMMWDMVLAAAVGLLAGVGFELYFRRHSPSATVTADGREELQ